LHVTSKKFEVRIEFLGSRYYIIHEIKFEYAMQKIQKFQFGRLYSATKSTKTYELIDRNGHRLIFRVRNPKTRDSWKQLATSTYKADQNGAFEEVLFSDGVRLNSILVTRGRIVPLTVAIAA